MLLNYFLIFLVTSGLFFSLFTLLTKPSGFKRINSLLNNNLETINNIEGMKGNKFPNKIPLLADKGALIKEKHFENTGILTQSGQQLFRLLSALWTIFLVIFSIVLVWSHRTESINSQFYALLAVMILGGLYSPILYLKYLKQKRNNNITEAIPDFIDLMVICTDSGLGFEAAIERVAKEIKVAYPVFSEEITMTNREIQAGYDKETALTNLMNRVNVDALNRFVSIFLQSCRFGTPISDSLRKLSSMQRNNHLLEIEEKAARTPVLILLPMVLCIFPSIFIVIVGPAVIQLSVAFAR